MGPTHYRNKSNPIAKWHHILWGKFASLLSLTWIRRMKPLTAKRTVPGPFQLFGHHRHRTHPRSTASPRPQANLINRVALRVSTALYLRGWMSRCLPRALSCLDLPSTAMSSSTSTMTLPDRNWPGKKSRFELSNMMRNLMSFRVTTKGPGPPTLESRGDHDIWSRRERHGHCGALTQTVVSPTQRSPLQLQGCGCCNFGSEERG